MDVILILAADDEFQALLEMERFAMGMAIAKLRSYDDKLPYPHSSQPRGSATGRKPRPRAGQSGWRTFYRRIREACRRGEPIHHTYARCPTSQQGCA